MEENLSSHSMRERAVLSSGNKVEMEEKRADAASVVSPVTLQPKKARPLTVSTSSTYMPSHKQGRR